MDTFEKSVVALICAGALWLFVNALKTLPVAIHNIMVIVNELSPGSMF